MDYEDLLYEIREDIAVITLNRPERLNALTPAMREGILQAILAADSDPEVRVIVLTGAGRGFCSGGDVKAMNEARSSGAVNMLEDKISPVRDKAVMAMRNAKKPLIAAINGPAAGAGMNIALACDIRIMSKAAKMGQTFSRRGLHPDWGGTYFLPRMIGIARAAEMIWSGRMVSAEECLELGIVSKLSEPEDLMNDVLAMAKTFAEGPPIAIRLAKRAMYRNVDSSLQEALEFETFAQNVAAATRDAKEGIAAFVEKRDPKFKGE